MKNKINKTFLDVEKATERGIIHRDYAAHFFRWSVVLRYVKRGYKVADIGCGNGILAQTLYTNKFKPELYYGVDIRPRAIDQLLNRQLNFPVDAEVMDIREDFFPEEYIDYFDLVVSFEVLEHFERDHAEHVLENIKSIMKPGATLLLSTPNYNFKSKAANHVWEYDENELENLLDKMFEIAYKFGTFASKADIYPVMTEDQQKTYDELKNYYDSNAMSVIFAPLYPSQSRNILWVCKK